MYLLTHRHIWTCMELTWWKNNYMEEIVIDSHSSDTGHSTHTDTHPPDFNKDDDAAFIPFELCENFCECVCQSSAKRKQRKLHHSDCKAPRDDITVYFRKSLRSRLTRDPGWCTRVCLCVRVLQYMHHVVKL